MLCKSLFLFLFIYLIFPFAIKQTLRIKIWNYESNGDLNIDKYSWITLIFYDYQLHYSNKFDLIKISFNIKCLDEEKKKILPSDLTLYYNLHILCLLKYNNNVNIIYSIIS